MASNAVVQTELSPQLAAIVRELDDVSAGFTKLVNELGAGKLWQRPAQGGWSVGECLDHLTTTTKEIVPKLEALLPTAPKGAEPYKMNWSGRMMAWLMEPPYRMKFKTTPAFEAKQSDKDVLSEFLASQDLAKEAVRRCNGLALMKINLPSPASARMHYNAYAALKLAPAHERRHLWHAQQIVKMM